MLKSMTAYSRSILVVPQGRFVVELQSVNRKFLEVNTFLPKSLIRFDSDIKKWIGQKVHRGQINARVSVVFDQVESTKVKPNIALARQIKAAWEQIADQLALPVSQFSLEMLQGEEGLLLYEEELQSDEPIKESLNLLFAQALAQLVDMKTREGQALQDDISLRLSKLKGLIDVISHKAPVAVKKYREKLHQKMQDALLALTIREDDERLMKEVYLFADKADIAEEITRFMSHLSQLNLMLCCEEEGMGKTIEFLIQELNREINTIGSKSSDAEIAGLVIEVKRELERIREQLQNVE